MRRMYAARSAPGPRSAPSPGSMLAMASMLSPYRVLDLTDGRADLATFVLAGLGADVVKVEPPGGSPSRADELSFHAFNRGKRSVTIDLEDEDGRRQFQDLIGTADFVFENAG